MTTRTPPKPRIAFAILYSALIFLLFLLVLDTIFRTTHLFGAKSSWSQPDSLIGYRFSADREYWYNLENDHPIRGRMNQFGWRDRQRTLEKERGTFRVALLGDSFVEALQVELDSTFLSITERCLSAGRPGSAEVLNFGRSGMTQTEELLILQRDVLQFSPDVVALLFRPGNDIRDVSRATAPNKLRPFYELDDGALILDTSFARTREFKLKTFINPIKQRSALFSFVVERYNSRRLSTRQGAIDRPATLPGAMTLCTSSPDPRYEKNYELCKILIREMAVACRSKGIRFMLIGMGAADEPADETLFRSIDGTFDPTFFDNDLSVFSDSTGIEYVGLRETFAKHHQASSGRFYWIHWNYAGHRVVADTLCRVLRP